MNDGSRPWIHLLLGPTREQAEARAASLTKTARLENRLVAPEPTEATGPAEIFAAWSERWCDAREERGLPSATHSTTEGYIREAEAVREGFGDV